jgi:hypothetical protein
MILSLFLGTPLQAPRKENPRVQNVGKDCGFYRQTKAPWRTTLCGALA